MTNKEKIANEVLSVPEESTPFDDVYRTMLEKCRKLIIPVLNECFGTSYGMDEEVLLLSNEHYYVEEGKIRKRITDSCIKVAGHIYHMECQSLPDTLMELRMFEYDVHVALANMEGRYKEHVLRFPESAVFYLRGKENVPDELSVRIVLPDQSEAIYRIPTIKLQNYSKEEIINKNLLFFIPYYILKFEEEMEKIDTEEALFNEVVGDYGEIYEHLSRLSQQESIDNLYLHYLTLLTTKLVDVVAKPAQNLRRKVSIMGGKVLELETDKFIEERNRIIAERDKAEEELGKLVEECDKVAEERDKVAEERDKAAEERDKAAEERDKAAEERDKVVAETDRMVREGEERGKVAAVIEFVKSGFNAEEACRIAKINYLDYCKYAQEAMVLREEPVPYENKREMRGGENV